MSILLTACGSKGDLYQAKELDITKEDSAEKFQQSPEEPKKKQP